MVSGLVGSPLDSKAGNKGKVRNAKHFFFCRLGAHLAVADLIEQRGFNALRVHKGRKSTLREEKKKLS